MFDVRRYCLLLEKFFVFLTITLPLAIRLAAQTPETIPASKTDLLDNPVSAELALTGATQALWQSSVEVEAGKTTELTVRIRFLAMNTAAFGSLELIPGLLANGNWILNNRPLKPPFSDLNYKIIPDLNPELLKSGENVLKATGLFTAKGSGSIDIDLDTLGIGLKGMPAAMLDLDYGPVLGWASTNSFTVSFRLNQPARAVLDVEGAEEIKSKPAAFHSFKATGLEPDRQYAFNLRLVATDGNVMLDKGPFFARTFPEHAPIEFVAVGDTRTSPETWGRVSEAILKINPRFTLFTGDMIADGRQFDCWRPEFFEPCRALLANVPMYVAPGNHEHNSSIVQLMFKTPGGGKNWSQTIANVHILGVDGSLDWAHNLSLRAWLERELATSQADFIFLADHYPPWSSSKHGVTRAGKPVQEQARSAREVILPLLAKHRATAIICGHDHDYERSEPPEGVTVIVTGGGGAPLYSKLPDAALHNPYSKAFASRNHFCRFIADENACVMTVLTPDGALLDTRTWEPRSQENE